MAKAKMRKRAISFLQKKKFYKDVADERDTLKQQLNEKRDAVDYYWFSPPGHYYSPLIDQNAKSDLPVHGLLDNIRPLTIPGVDINQDKLVALFEKLYKNFADFPDYTQPSKTHRYQFENDQFGEMDAAFLFMMLRHLKPKRVIEVGSGWSSCLMLDVNEHFNAKTHLTFIEPYPERLLGAMKRGDKKQCTLITKGVQDIPLSTFDKLQKDDILFIDSSHVSKTGSDVNYLVFNVIPRLKKGVVIHIHDILFPFEYPREWVVNEMRNWNEVYIIHALLMSNKNLEIVQWGSYLWQAKRPLVKQVLTQKPYYPGGSIWLRVV